MSSKFKSFLYNQENAKRRLQVAGVALSCDRDPDVNRARIADTVIDIMQAHPEAELVVFGEMILGWYHPGEMPEYHRRISQPISDEMLQPFSCSVYLTRSTAKPPNTACSRHSFAAI